MKYYSLFFFLINIVYCSLINEESINKILSLVVVDPDFYFKDYDINEEIVIPVKENGANDLYIIKNKYNGSLLVVKQSKDMDFYYELEKDFIFSNLYKIFLLNISNDVEDWVVHYIPPYVLSKVKKNNNNAAIVMPYYSPSNVFCNDNCDIQIRIDIFQCLVREKDKGFSTDLLDIILKHEDLFYIVALDVFFCNSDRSPENLFYFFDSSKKVCIDCADCFFLGNLVMGLEIINSIKRLSSDEKLLYSNILKKLQAQLHFFYDNCNKSVLINLFKKLRSFYNASDIAIKSSLLNIINIINIHYFFLEYIIFEMDL